MSTSRKLVAFDLDDTLAVTKSAIDPRMASLLGRLLENYEVCIISGGRFEQFQAQVLSHLPEHVGAGLHLMPTCGTRYYRREGGEWELQYAEDLADEDKALVTSLLEEGARSLGLWEEAPHGDVVEDRGSQITFSALGQQAPPEAKYAWDPDGTKKEALRAWVAQRAPHLEVRSGGSTSVDVTRAGIDKAYGMRRLLEATGYSMGEVVFVGDRLDVGGNDYPVKEMGFDTIAVEGWEETALVIETILAL